MARKRPAEDPPPAASSDEDPSEGNSSASDEEEEKSPLKKPKGDAGKVGSDSEYESDEFPPSPNVSDFTIKPVVPKPNKSAPKPKHTDNEPSSKRKKPSPSASNGGAGAVKSPVTVRRWSEAEEITILNGLIEYRSKEGSDSFKDSSSGFHDFIKKRFQTDVSKTQLNEKIRRLKGKYKSKAEKGQNGDDPDLPNPHDRKCFHLSKKIWGNEANEKINNTQKTAKNLSGGDEDKAEKETKTSSIEEEQEVNKTHKKAKTLSTEAGDKTEAAPLCSTQISSGSEEDNVDFWKEYPCLKEFFKIGFTGKWGHTSCSVLECVEMNANVIGREKLKEMEKEGRQLRIEELELDLKRSKLAHEIAKATLDAIKGTGI
ncbi:hypothetical protein HRI_004306800 [Hibiscus trionum]|uniref:Glabrous enhancer-binding protein-like DBD domain-containing protein n=1 Tax=Hibiscus trionum TaxID=183268 RepID=A0A9W7J226_HIBTR|nr:hypothetical protein HRI_004306800 [Hibiscus trionum]